MKYAQRDRDWQRLCARAFHAPWLTAERERELVERAQSGDQAAKAELYSSYLRLVVQIAGRYRNASLAFDDLVSEGSLGLLEAIRRYDLTVSTRLGTYAAWWIQAYVRRYAHANRSLVLPPSTRAVRATFSRMRAAQRTLAQTLGRWPTRRELAARLGVPEDAVDVVYATSLPAVSIAPFEGTDIADERATPEEECAERADADLRRTAVRSSVAALPERDRQIIEAHFLEGEASMAQLGAKLGVSRQRVSQVVKRVRRQLAERLEASVPELVSAASV